MLLRDPQQHFAQRPTENKLYKKSCFTLGVAMDVVCFLPVAVVPLDSHDKMFVTPQKNKK